MSELESINRALRILHFTKSLFDQNKDKTDLQKWWMLIEAHFPEYNLLELMENFDRVKQRSNQNECIYQGAKKRKPEA